MRDEGVKRDDVHDDRAEQQQADISQARNHHDDAAGELKHFHELDVARRDERFHEVPCRRASASVEFDEVETRPGRSPRGTKAPVDARDAAQVFFHVGFGWSVWFG